VSYCVRVAGNGPTFGVGSYQLTVSYNLSNGTIVGPVTGLLDPESGLNDTLGSALSLPSRLVNGQKPDARFDYTVKSSISSGQDVDFYRVRAPDGAGQKMNVLVWGLEATRLLPKVEVFDSAGNLVPATLLANENGTFSVEVTNVVSGGTYSIKVGGLSRREPRHRQLLPRRGLHQSAPGRADDVRERAADGGRPDAGGYADRLPEPVVPVHPVGLGGGPGRSSVGHLQRRR